MGKSLIKRIMLIILGTLTVLTLVSYLMTVYLTLQDIRNENSSTMEIILAEVRRGGDSDVLDDIASPYFVLSTDGAGGVVMTRNEYFDSPEPAEIAAIAAAAEQGEEATGDLEEFGLRYLRRTNGSGWEIVFMDTALVHQYMQILMINCALIYVCVWGILFLSAYLLARMLSRPVEQAWREQQRFVSDASHELKTPLTVILANAEMLSDHPEASQPQRQEWTESIIADARHMKALVADLLDLAKTGNPTQKESFRDVDFSSAATQAALVYEPLFYEAGLFLEHEIDPGFMVHGDEWQLQQLVRLLLDNAVKYATVGTTVWLGVHRLSRSLLQLRISNASAPIPEAAMESLFERFYRYNDGQTRKTGTGLGLPIAKNIAEYHQGTIKAACNDGQFSITVRLPCQDG